MSDHNVVLIGMPGVGKSTVGVLVAKRLGLSFLDTDIYIQTREGKSLQQLIGELGLEGFRVLEERHMLTISTRAHVLATGGSVVYSAKAMDHLKATGTVIHLDLALELLKKRLDDLEARGVVIAPGQSLDSLYYERLPLYLQYADVTVSTGSLTPDQIVRKLVDILS
jgi:shikimate kinase